MKRSPTGVVDSHETPPRAVGLASDTPPDSPGILAVGHSTRSWDELVELLRAHGVEILADVRTVPRSRANPQFSREHMGQGLPAAGIRYAHLPELGGLRRPRPDSTNLAWEHAGFRGYADYMETPEFEQALLGLLRLAGTGRTAIMCAEGNPWRCHRRLLADALVARGVPVAHIVSRKSVRPHALTPFARVVDGIVRYPAAPSVSPPRDPPAR